LSEAKEKSTGTGISHQEHLMREFGCQGAKTDLKSSKMESNKHKRSTGKGQTLEHSKSDPRNSVLDLRSIKPLS
jgi:hypothetical protein